MAKKEAEIHDKIVLSDYMPVTRGCIDMTDVYIKEAGRQVKRAKEAFNTSLKTEGEERKKALWDEKQGALFTIIFSVFALEAEINKIGHDSLDNDVWEGLKRIRLAQKWFLFPKLIKDTSFNRDDRLFKNFRTVIDLRNRLVHFKDYEYKEFIEHKCGNRVEGSYEYINVDNAELAYKTAINMMKELKNILKR